MLPGPHSFGMLCMRIVLCTIFTELSIRNAQKGLTLYCMAQAPCNPGHSALVRTSDSPGNHEGLRH